MQRIPTNLTDGAGTERGAALVLGGVWSLRSFSVLKNSDLLRNVSHARGFRASIHAQSPNQTNAVLTSVAIIVWGIDEPAVVAAIDLVRWQLSLLGPSF
jgi:hypothetical protein